MTARTARVLSLQILPWVLLAISLGLNVFFIGGHVYGKHYLASVYGGDAAMKGAGAHPARLVQERLNLSPEQQSAFQEMRTQVRERGMKLRTASKSLKDELWQEMGGDSPDMKKVEGLLRSLSDNRLGFQLEMARLAQGFMGGLNPDQRQEFLEIGRARRVFGRGPGYPIMRPGEPLGDKAPQELKDE